MVFLDIDTSKEDISMKQLSRLSFVQGIFRQQENNRLSVVDVLPDSNYQKNWYGEINIRGKPMGLRHS